MRFDQGPLSLAFPCPPTLVVALSSTTKLVCSDMVGPSEAIAPSMHMAGPALIYPFDRKQYSAPLVMCVGVHATNVPLLFCCWLTTPSFSTWLRTLSVGQRWAMRLTRYCGKREEGLFGYRPLLHFDTIKARNKVTKGSTQLNRKSPPKKQKRTKINGKKGGVR
jgi:hypothetical protein